MKFVLGFDSLRVDRDLDAEIDKSCDNCLYLLMPWRHPLLVEPEEGIPDCKDDPVTQNRENRQ